MNVFSRTKSLIVIIAILLVSNIVLLAYFLTRGEPGDARKRPDSSEFFKKTLGFTSEQYADFEKRKDLHRDSISRYFQKLDDDKEKFYRLLGQSPVDSVVFDSMANQIGKQQVAIDRAFFRHFQDIRTICTPPQRILYDSLFPGELKKIIAGRRRK